MVRAGQFVQSLEILLIKHVDEDGPSELERALAHHPEDKPAPLFVRKESANKEDTEQAGADHSQDIDQSVVTLQGQESTNANEDGTAYETELDGTPVVGDLLKIQFVDHKVVPTVLVSKCSVITACTERTTREES